MAAGVKWGIASVPDDKRIPQMTTSSPSGSVDRPALWERWLLGVICAVQAVVVVALLATLPYWLDEAASLLFVQRPLGEMLRYLRNDIHPPLYFILLWGWVKIVGTSTLATAILSLISTLLGGFFLRGLARELAGHRVACTAVGLYALSFTIAYYATETRMYAMFLALGLGANWALVLLLRHPQRRWPWVWYAVATVLGVYTHYLYWLVVGAQQVVVLCWHRRRQLWLRWAAMYALILLLFLPWALVMVTRLLDKTGQLSWMSQAPLGAVWLTILVSGFYPMNPLNLLRVSPLVAWLGVAMLLGLLFIRRVTTTVHGLILSFERSPATMLIVVVGLLPVLVGTIVGLAFPRYFMPSIGLIFLAVAIAEQRWRLAPAVRISAVVMLSVLNINAAIGLHQFPAYRWSEVAAYVANQAAGPGGVVLLVDQLEWITFRYYYSGAYPVQSFLPYTRQHQRELNRLRIAGLPVVTTENVRDVMDSVMGYQTVWLVEGPSMGIADPQGLVSAWLGRHCTLRAARPVVIRGPDAISVAQFHLCNWPAHTQPLNQAQDSRGDL